MFKYINMPRLVAHYLKEFSVGSDGNVSTLYRFVFCLCLPFVSSTFNRARLEALAIAECTNSRDQIFRLMYKLTGAVISNVGSEYFVAYDASSDLPDFAFDGSNDVAAVPFDGSVNYANLLVSLNGCSADTFTAYFQLLVPFYVSFTIEFI